MVKRRSLKSILEDVGKGGELPAGWREIVIEGIEEQECELAKSKSEIGRADARRLEVEGLMRKFGKDEAPWKMVDSLRSELRELRKDYGDVLLSQHNRQKEADGYAGRLQEAAADLAAGDAREVALHRVIERTDTDKREANKQAGIWEDRALAAERDLQMKVAGEKFDSKASVMIHLDVLIPDIIPRLIEMASEMRGEVGKLQESLKSALDREDLEISWWAARVRVLNWKLVEEQGRSCGLRRKILRLETDILEEKETGAR